MGTITDTQSTIRLPEIVEAPYIYQPREGKKIAGPLKFLARKVIQGEIAITPGGTWSTIVNGKETSCYTPKLIRTALMFVRKHGTRAKVSIIEEWRPRYGTTYTLELPT